MASISVGLAEIKFSKNPEDVIVAHGLGSCIGLGIFDASAHLGGMAHIVLPDSAIQPNSNTPERFADTAIPLLIEKFQVLGGNISLATVKIVGGANMFKYNAASLLDIGGRNIAAVKEMLGQANLRILSEHVGGTNGRTFKIYIQTGRFTCRLIGRNEEDI